MQYKNDICGLPSHSLTTQSLVYSSDTFPQTKNKLFKMVFRLSLP